MSDKKSCKNKISTANYCLLAEENVATGRREDFSTRYLWQSFQWNFDNYESLCGILKLNDSDLRSSWNHFVKNMQYGSALKHDPWEYGVEGSSHMVTVNYVSKCKSSL